MILSKSSIYGLRSAVLLAEKKGCGFISIRELSDELGLSFYFLTKVLQRLSAAGIVESYKGPNGGVRLIKDPDKISFMDIIFAIEGDLDLHECILGLSTCGDDSPCLLHGKWSNMRNIILELLQDTTLAGTQNPYKEFPDLQTIGDLIRRQGEKI